MKPGRRTSSLFSPQTWDAGSRGRLPLIRWDLSPRPSPLTPTTPFKTVVGSSGAQVGGAAEQEVYLGNSSVFPFPQRDQEKFPLNWASIQEAKVKGKFVSMVLLAAGSSLGCTSFVHRSCFGVFFSGLGEQ